MHFLKIKNLDEITNGKAGFMLSPSAYSECFRITSRMYAQLISLKIFKFLNSLLVVIIFINYKSNILFIFNIF